MSSEKRQLHVLFLPMLALGHMIPTIDMAKLFVTRGSKPTSSLLLPISLSSRTQLKEARIRVSKSISRSSNFPPTEVGLPEGCDAIPNGEKYTEMTMIFFKAIAMLQEPLEELLEECRPNCLVADMFFSWANEAASKFGIPRLFFNGCCFFSVSVAACMMNEPHKNVSTDADPFVLPGLPGDITLTRKQLAKFILSNRETDLSKLLKKSREEDSKSYGNN